jgi:hypothetical protein
VTVSRKIDDKSPNLISHEYGTQSTTGLSGSFFILQALSQIGDGPGIRVRKQF